MLIFAKVVVNGGERGEADSRIFDFFQSREFSINGEIDLESGYQILFKQIYDQIPEKDIQQQFLLGDKIVKQAGVKVNIFLNLRSQSYPWIPSIHHSRLVPEKSSSRRTEVGYSVSHSIQESIHHPQDKDGQEASLGKEYIGKDKVFTTSRLQPKKHRRRRSCSMQYASNISRDTVKPDIDKPKTHLHISFNGLLMSIVAGILTALVVFWLLTKVYTV